MMNNTDEMDADATFPNIHVHAVHTVHALKTPNHRARIRL
jgi:hypothetical protein